MRGIPELVDPYRPLVDFYVGVPDLSAISEMIDEAPTWPVTDYGVIRDAEIEPEREAIYELAAYYEQEYFGRTFDLDRLRDLDILQRAADSMRDERRFSVAAIAQVDRAITNLQYRGEPDQGALASLGGAADGSRIACSKRIPPLLDSIERAMANLPVHGSTVGIEMPSGHMITGTVESWGPMSFYGRKGLGLAVNRDDGRSQVLDLGYDRFSLLRTATAKRA